MNNWRAAIVRLVGLVLVGLSAGAWAGQSASMTCVKYTMPDHICERYELWVTISSDGDIGRTGGFGVAVQLEDGKLAYWTAKEGFGAYRGGLVQPAEGIMPALPASRSYLVFAGLIPSLCALAGYRSFDIYAGYGSVPPAREAQLEYLLSFKFPLKISVDHIRGAYIQADVHQNPWKIGQVYTWKNEWCNNISAEAFLTGTAPIRPNSAF